MRILESDPRSGYNYLQKCILLNKSRSLSDAERNHIYTGFLQSMIISSELNIKDLNIELKKEQISISGTARSAEDKEISLLMMLNLQGVASVVDKISLDQDYSSSKLHRIEMGETLSLLAKAYYNDSLKFDILYHANERLIKDANILLPGCLIRIPDLKD